MAGRLQGKTAIVTGAGSIGPGWGNGKATAVLYAREGARILAVDLNPEAARETHSLIRAEGGTAEWIEADVSRSADVQAVVRRCIELYGAIDILHNNVGIVEVGGPVEISEENWDRLMAVNVKSVYLTCKYAIPHMLAAGKGSIVNFGSISWMILVGDLSAYTASKAAMHGLS
ncbi:MAG TPA: SDR family NAD(P)-dependent oxidoreductase, partial [Burkholderiales bacterium]|nr:SDR family NAD(P)-dependent oxidoreductase [Burkholderiales bacterium]